jgi:hypothetical protein
MQKKMVLSKVKRAKLDMSRSQFRIPDDVAAAMPKPAYPPKINTQFQWKDKPFIDDNSVHDYPHPPVEIFNGKPPMKSSNDSVTIPTITTGVEYHYLPSSNTSLAGGMSVSDEYQRGGGTVKSSIPKGLIASVKNVNRMLPTIYPAPGSGPLPYVDEEEEVYDQNSEYAVRSNYHSEHSTRCDPIVPVKMERLRNLKRLTNYHVKEKFHLVSRKNKEKILADRAFDAEFSATH